MGTSTGARQYRCTPPRGDAGQEEENHHAWGDCGEGGERGLYFTRCCEGQHGTIGVAIFVALAGADELGIP